MTKFVRSTSLLGYSDSFSISGAVLVPEFKDELVELRLESSTRARYRCTSPSKRLLRYEACEAEMTIFGGEELESSIADESAEYATSAFWDARARRASAFLGFERRAWERAIVRHLVSEISLISNKFIGIIILLESGEVAVFRV